MCKCFNPGSTIASVSIQVHGEDGAGHIGQLLKERGVKLDFLLDEGLPVLENVIKGIPVPVAM